MIQNTIRLSMPKTLNNHHQILLYCRIFPLTQTRTNLKYKTGTIMFEKKLFSLVTSVLFFFFSLTEIHAVENKFPSVKAAFLNFSVTLEDGDIPYSDTKWRIVFAEDNLNAFGSEEILLQGVTDSNGKVIFTVKQREQIFSAWQTRKDNVWFVYELRAYRLSVKSDATSYKIKMLWRGDEDILISTKSSAQPLKKLSKSIYTQAHFKSEKFAKEFLDWKKIFLSELESFRLEMKKDSDYGKGLLEPENKKNLVHIFANSIDAGEKGSSLKKMIVSAAYSTDRRVWPPGLTFVQLVSSDEATPVGYGGKFDDSGRGVELWYMVFNDLSSWTQRDLNESNIFSAFNSPELPKNGVTKRNSWPAVVFVRDEHNRLRMYALSAEFSNIIESVYKAQIR